MILQTEGDASGESELNFYGNFTAPMQTIGRQDASYALTQVTNVTDYYAEYFSNDVVQSEMTVGDYIH